VLALQQDEVNGLATARAAAPALQGMAGYRATPPGRSS
jgi:hypothetical protein